ncbi:flagellar protein FlaG [Undibacterium sp. Ji67W]|uniref:flagellar protein FlaG n=1 Tax=Undibacterium sp. Ji67W TaxID=3413042 RepID=UPI003BF0F0B1
MDIPSIGNSTPPGQITPDKSVAPVPNPQAVATSSQATPANATSQIDNKKSVDEAELSKAVNDINKSLQDKGRGVRFSIDQDSKRVVVKVIDQNTNQVLSQIPTEQTLEISKSLDKLQGLLVKQEV